MGVAASLLVATAGLILAQAGGDSDPLWKFATIPLVAGVIGWGTNWLAIKMTFNPVEFVGIPPYLGWQGIIPSRAHKMASISMDRMMGKIGTVETVLDEMDPQGIAAHLLATMKHQVPTLVDELASREYPRLWANTPEPIRQAVYARAAALLPRTMDRMVGQLRNSIGQLVDMRMMVIDELTTHKETLNRIFQEAGAKEFRFLVNSGLYFGFVLGLIQMGVQVWLNEFWVLPVFGLFVGYATNWLALKMIFEPVEPVKIGPFILHAQFLKRKSEISEYFAHTTSREFLTIEAFVNRMLTGPQADRTHRLILDNVKPLVDEAMGIVRPAVQVAVGPKEYEALKEDLATRTLELLPVAMSDPAFSESRAVLVEKAMYETMSSLDNEEFAGILRPVVEEDEWKLIAVGAVLGGLAGLAQAALVFGSSGG